MASRRMSWNSTSVSKMWLGCFWDSSFSFLVVMGFGTSAAAKQKRRHRKCFHRIFPKCSPQLFRGDFHYQRWTIRTHPISTNLFRESSSQNLWLAKLVSDRLMFPKSIRGMLWKKSNLFWCMCSIVMSETNNSWWTTVTYIITVTISNAEQTKSGSNILANWLYWGPVESAILGLSNVAWWVWFYWVYWYLDSGTSMHECHYMVRFNAVQDGTQNVVLKNDLKLSEHLNTKSEYTQSSVASPLQNKTWHVLLP